MNAHKYFTEKVEDQNKREAAMVAAKNINILSPFIISPLRYTALLYFS